MCHSARHHPDSYSKITTEEEWSDDDSKCDSFFNRFKTSEQNKYTDRLSDGFFYFYFLFLTASFHYFLPTVFSSGSLICKQTVKRVWQLRVQTAEREKSTIIIITSMRTEQLSCLTVSVSYLSICQSNVDKLRLHRLQQRLDPIQDHMDLVSSKTGPQGPDVIQSRMSCQDF